jgi:Rod binding domain-containing protein
MGAPFAAIAAIAGASAPLANSLQKALAAPKDKAREAAQDFEAVFLSTMFGQMFTDTDGEGPMGGGAGTGVWRSFLTDEYAKSFAKSGGIGLADHVHRALIAQQEQATRPAATETKP